MKLTTLTAKKTSGYPETLVLHVRETNNQKFINFLLAITPEKIEQDFFLSFPTITYSVKESAEEFEKFAKNRWGARSTVFSKEVTDILLPDKAHDIDELFITLRQEGIDPEDKGITRKDLVWFRVKTVEHFSDRLEFYSEAHGDHGQVDVIIGGEDYAIGNAKFREENGLADTYAFLCIRPVSWTHYPESLRIEPPL